MGLSANRLPPIPIQVWTMITIRMKMRIYRVSIIMTHHDTSIFGFYRPMNFWDFGISGPKLSETPGRGSFWVRLHAEPISSQSMRVWESSQAKSKRSAISRENVWILGSYGILLGSYMIVAYFLYVCIIFYHILSASLGSCSDMFRSIVPWQLWHWNHLDAAQTCQTMSNLKDFGWTWSNLRILKHGWISAEVSTGAISI